MSEIRDRRALGPRPRAILSKVFELDELRLHHYPELRHVALGAYVRGLLGELGYEPERVDGAAIIVGDRYSQVCTASSQRLFMFGLWSKGVSYGHGKTDSARAMVDAIAAFVFERKSVDEMARRFPFVELTSAARAHERGELVEHRWAEYLAWDAETVVRRALLPMVQQASCRPKLRRLFPFVDLGSLHLSRTTGYPYRTIDAWAAPVIREKGGAFANRLVPGRYEVFVGEPRCARSLGEGDATWAAEALERAVPDDTGPAADGTVDR